MSFLSSTLRAATVGLGLFALLGRSAGAPSPQLPGPTIQSDTTVPSRPVVKKLFVRGMTEAVLEDYEEAVTYFEKALDRAPSEPALLQALADAHAARGEHTTALFYARQARRHGQERAYYHRLAELQQQAGDPDAALQTYRDLLDRFPKNANAYRGLARLQSDLERPRAALRTYETLLERRSTPSVEVYREMLRLYRRVENPQGERKTLQALLERRPDNRRYRRRLAQLYAEENQLEAAIDLLEPMLEETPNDTTLRRQLRHLYREAGRTRAASSLAQPRDSANAGAASVDQLVSRARSTYDDATASPSAPDTSLLDAAAERLEQALEQAPDHVDALVLLARIHEQKGEYQQAGEALERALDENPRVPSRWVRAAAAYLKADRHEKAAALSEEGLLLFPGQYRLARTAAYARLRLREAKQALTHFREALDLLSDDTTSTSEIASLKAGLGRAYSQLGRPRKAENTFEEALSIAPNHLMALTHYADLLAQQNEDLDRALAMAQRAVKRAPTDPNALGVLGWVYFRKGNIQAARTHLQKALEAGAASARVFEQYGDVQHALGNEATARRYWRKALERAPHRTSLREKLGRDPNT